MSENKIAYFELPSTNVSALKEFYGQLFGWTFQDYGDDYAAVENGGLEGGFNGDPASKSKAPMVIVETADIRTTLKRVQEAGSTITMQIFAYPGGQRFHFLDPSGNELAIFQPGT
ncbi:VOC family protein [Granulicella sp. WH15]|uniref:VOC family protein n=1 Tax=Granulicella sp. WH15 TaxID=2602070 RepID=UPI001366FD7E|nr:VOC family protein [Granulicella sp. WH15]QHN05186.1 VOC family protein [Granulicella sp. WH15]